MELASFTEGLDEMRENAVTADEKSEVKTVENFRTGVIFLVIGLILTMWFGLSDFP